MDNSLQHLCDAIKTIINELKPRTNPLSFLILIGKNKQGKSALLRQSQLEEYQLYDEHEGKIYYNHHGLILELSETWINKQNRLLKHSLKQLNRCHPAVKISGIILCVDTNSLLLEDFHQQEEHHQANVKLLKRFLQEINYPVDCFLLFSKIDVLSGFSEFYQNEHYSELAKPLGFNLGPSKNPQDSIKRFLRNYDQLVELLGQQIISKIHPARSSLKRTLIREFPLQLLSLRRPIHTLLQKMVQQNCPIEAIYFTSAEQGGTSVDRLDKKIQHEYALSVRETYSQATNYRSYFVDGAIELIQKQTSRPLESGTFSRKKIAYLFTAAASICIFFLIAHHFKTRHILDETSKELLTYQSLINLNQDRTEALYHLTKAHDKITQAHSNQLILPSVNYLKTKLQANAQQQLNTHYLPSLTQELEDVISDPQQTPVNRYKALKIYLMLDRTDYFSFDDVSSWFQQHWNQLGTENIEKKLKLLKHAFRQPLPKVSINQDIIRDTRNYLNALPQGYFYYSLAKELFPKETQQLDIKGFHLATNALPVYYTRQGFEDIVKQLPNISKTLKADQWVLLNNKISIQSMLLEAYAYDYVTWWNQFIKHSKPLHYQNYLQGKAQFKTLRINNSIFKLLSLIQEQTKANVNNENAAFNQYITNHFTELNFISQSSLTELSQNLKEMEQFMTTLSLVNDYGKSAFNVTKARFSGRHLSDPITALFKQSEHLPETVSNWTRQIAEDSWVLLINQSREYINRQRQETVFQEYTHKIANRYPFANAQSNDVYLADFNQFFSKKGRLNQFFTDYLKPFLNTTEAQWKPKTLNGYILPISSNMINEMIRANIITNMFFPGVGEESQIQFSLQKINLDPIVSKLELQIGNTQLKDNQDSHSYVRFKWPQANAKLTLESIDGNQYVLDEKGTWAIFRLLEKVNLYEDHNDSKSMQILFEINSNSGRYLLRTTNLVNPFTPGILKSFSLTETVV